MSPKETTAKVRTIVKILREVTSIQVVSGFLKEKGLKYSASKWDDLLEKRILPAVLSDPPSLSIDDLTQLLRDSEECGRQHVFLYKTSAKTAAELLETKKLHSALEAMGIKNLLSEAKALDQPENASFSDVRIEGNPSCLVIKRIETRLSQKAIGEDIVGNVLTKTYELKKERAVNLIRLHADGLLEIRIGSHSNSSNYKHDINVLMASVKSIIPFESFSGVSLSTIKDKLWKDRSSLSTVVKFTHSTLRNDIGTVLQAACSNEDDLVDDEGVTSSLDNFIDHDAYCDASNVWFKKQSDGTPAKNVHILFAGEMNEFAVPAHCAKADYEYALSKVRELN